MSVFFPFFFSDGSVGVMVNEFEFGLLQGVRAQGGKCSMVEHGPNERHQVLARAGIGASGVENDLWLRKWSTRAIFVIGGLSNIPSSVIACTGHRT